MTESKPLICEHGRQKAICGECFPTESKPRECKCKPCKTCGALHGCDLSIPHPGWRAHAAHMRRRGETTSENSLHRSEQPDLPLGHEFEPCPSLMPDGFPARFCMLKSPKQTECHFWHLHPAHYCGQPESAHRRKP